jgi:hypothetical protein
MMSVLEYHESAHDVDGQFLMNADVDILLIVFIVIPTVYERVAPTFPRWGVILLT